MGHLRDGTLGQSMSYRTYVTEAGETNTPLQFFMVRLTVHEITYIHRLFPYHSIQVAVV